MQDIRMEYGDQVFEVPKNWNEINPDQFKLLVGLINGEFEGYTKNREFLTLFSGMPVEAIDGLMIAEVIALINLMGWIKDDPVHAESFVPRVGIFKGPQKSFSNILFGQWLMADQEFKKVVEFRKDDPKKYRKHLKNLIGILYRPSFLPYSKKLIGLWKWISVFVSEDREGEIIQNYWGLRNWIYMQYEDVFGSNGGSGKNYGPMGLIVDIAGEKFGSVTKAERVGIHFVLIELDKNENMRKRMEDKTNH